MLGLRVAFAISLALAPSPQNKEQPRKADKTPDADQRGTAQSPAIVKVIGPEKSEAEASREAAEKAEHERNEWIVAWSTAALALLTLGLATATAVLVRYTWRLWKTTNTLVIDGQNAAGAQSAEWEKQRDVMTRQLAAMEVQAHALTAQGSQLEREFTAEHRPWLACDVEITSPLTWREDGGWLRLNFILRNTGRTPALYTWVWPKIYPSEEGFPEPAAEQRRISEQERTRPRIPWLAGYTIFRDAEVSVPIEVGITNRDVEQCRVNFEKIGGDPEFFGFSVVVVGCVDYCSVLGKTHHQTGFILDLRATDPIHGGWQRISPKDGDLPPERLSLTISSAGSGITD